MNILTAKDIQVKNVRTDSNPNNQNKIRKSWLLVLDEATKDAIKAKIKTPEARWAYYEALDSDVSNKWVELMRKHFNDSIKAGAKIIPDRFGPDRLEDDYCVDADEQLVIAGQLVAEEVISEFSK